MTRAIFLWSNLILIATLLTLATVLIGNSQHGYGFPLAWKTGGCTPPGISVSVSCLRAIVSDWLSFGVDVLLYTFVAYVLVLSYSKYLARRRLL